MSETASKCSAHLCFENCLDTKFLHNRARTKKPVGFDLPAFFFDQQHQNFLKQNQARHDLLNEFVRLDSRFSHFHRYHLTIATKKAELDEQYLKLLLHRWRSFCDVRHIKFVCYDEDGTEHLHVILWSTKPFELDFNYPFKNESLRLKPVENGWKSSSDNGYCLFCLRPHNNAQKLIQYILKEHNLNLDCLRASGRHFYAASQGINTVAIQRAFRRFCAISDTVRQSTEQLGILLSKLKDSQKQAESVKSFMSELFGISRDDARGRSIGWNISRYRSPRLLTPHTPTRRRDFLFYTYEYQPYSQRELTWLISSLSEYGPKFQARLIPKMLYDMVCHSWATDPCLSMPPIPLEDFFSDDFLYVGSDMSHELTTNPEYEKIRLRQLMISKT